MMVSVLHTRYGDAVRELDYGVGAILDTLKSSNIEKDTLVIFSSDNGAATYAKYKGKLFQYALCHDCMKYGYESYLI